MIQKQATTQYDTCNLCSTNIYEQATPLLPLFIYQIDTPRGVRLRIRKECVDELTAEFGAYDDQQGTVPERA